MLVRQMVNANEVTPRMIMPGDILAGGESALAGAIATVGAGTWTGAAIATGIINRTGSTAGYTDTTDTAANILTAIAGDAWAAVVVPGQTFRLIVQNTVAFALTWAAGTGVLTGNGTLNIAASLVREYLITVLNTTPVQLHQCATTNGSAVVTFVLATGQVALGIGPFATNANGITPGASVTGTGIPTSTTILGVTLGVGGITGVTLSANATATSTGVALTFGPTVQFDSIRSSTL